MFRFAFSTLAAILILATPTVFNAAHASKVVGIISKDSIMGMKSESTSMAELRLAMKSILQKQRYLERALVVRTKQLQALRAKKGVKGGRMKLNMARRTLRKLKARVPVSVSGIWKATKFSRMKAAVRQARYETKHMRRLLSLKTRELRKLKNIKAVSRFRNVLSGESDKSIHDVVEKLKQNNYHYGDTQFPEACACQMLPVNAHSKCYYFYDATETTCKYRRCKATFVCTPTDITGLVCMRRRKTSKLVVLPGVTSAGLAHCSRQNTDGYVYVPYTHAG